MANMKRWMQVGQGALSKWTEPGQTLEGQYQGASPGKFGDLGTIEKEGGERVSFPVHTALGTKLSQIKTGAEIRIIYKGMRTSKGGTEYKDFEVFVASPDDMAGRPSAEPDDDIPF